jgi:hypothetical protein
MTKQERPLLINWDGSVAYWERRYKQTEYKRKQPDKQANQNSDIADIVLLWILGTIGLLAMLVAAILHIIL